MAGTCEETSSTPSWPVPAQPLLFDATLRGRLEANLAGLDRLSFTLDGRRAAAVAVVVVESEAPGSGTDLSRTGRTGPTIPNPTPGSVAEPDGSGRPSPTGEAAVLVTRRAVRLQAHAGQWALPGGRVETGESALDAALRELREEVGLALDSSALVGMLDDYPTRSGYVITPFVFWGGVDPTITPDPREVRSVHRVSLGELCRPDSPRFIAIPESDRPVVQVLVGDGLIHAPTGAVLLQFRRVGIEGVLERVAGYEQPVFAWQ